MAAIAFRPSIAALEFSGSKESVIAEPVHPFVAYNPNNEIASNTRWNWFWKVNAIASAVSFIAAAVFAVGYTITYLAVHTPLVSMVVSLVAIPLSFKVFKYLWDRSSFYAMNASIDGQLIKQMELVDDIELPVRLSALGVDPGIAPELLKGIFARYCYFKDRQHHANEESKKIFDPAYPGKEIELKINKNVIKIRPHNYTVENVNFADKQEVSIFKELQAKRAERDYHRLEAANCNLKAAYLLKLMQSPYEKRQLDEFFQWNPFNSPQLLIANSYDDQGTDILIKTQSRSYSTGELRNKDTTSLAREVFELPKKWYQIF